MMIMLAGACTELPPNRVKAPPVRDSKACFQSIVEILAADEFEGRGVGTRGLDRAAQFLMDRVRQMGLEGGGATYSQVFSVNTGVALGAGNTLIDGAGPLQVGADFMPFAFSASAEYSGDLVFASYGIRAKELNYDDYAGLPVKGKVLLVFRYEPGESDANSPFNGLYPSRWSDLRYKAMLAREAEAKALILVNSVKDAQDKMSDALPPLRLDGITAEAGIPVLQVTRQVAQRWLDKAGQDLTKLQKAIDSSYQPHSRLLTGVRLEGRTDLQTVKAEVRNILGVIPGRGNLAQEVVVVGAHYDHLGYGGQGSFRPEEVVVHNGADDNASGVAAMLCGVGDLKQTLEDSNKPHRTLVMVAFAAEERGLVGSSWYVQHPLYPLDNTIAMINLDMVGRVRDNTLHALGAGSAAEWQTLLPPLAAPAGLVLRMGGDGYGPSDQTPFYAVQTPVLHLFSGVHAEYHTPDDDTHTLNMAGGAQVSDLLARLLKALLQRPGRLSYKEPAGEPLMAGDSRGYGAYLGSIPDYTSMDAKSGGVLLSGVRRGGPADHAGLRAGDRIVAMAGVTIHNLYDLTFVLRDQRPGESIMITVDRGGQALELLATLQKRPTGQSRAQAPAD